MATQSEQNLSYSGLIAVPRDSFIRETFTKASRGDARQAAYDYFERFPKERYQTEVESWREVQSNIQFTMKRLREPIG